MLLVQTRYYLIILRIFGLSNSFNHGITENENSLLHQAGELAA